MRNSHIEDLGRLTKPRSRRTGSIGAWICSAALPAVAVALAVMFVGAILPTPLYPAYRHAFGFDGVTLTLIYAVYVLGNLVALLCFGRLSDRIGRRWVTLPTIGAGFGSTLLFLFADGTAWLFAARALSGLATGLAAGTTTAWIAELQPRGDKAVAAAIASAANFGGCAVAPLSAGLLAQFAPWPLRLAFAIYLGMLILTAIAILATPETVGARAHRLSEVSLRPRLSVPREIRLAFIPPAATAFATFALIGFYAALLPSLLKDRLHESSPAVSGAIVFELFLVAAAVAALTGKTLTSRATMLAGLALLPPSLALLVVVEGSASLPLLIATTVLAGLAGGLGYRGSLEVVNRISPGDKGSEVVSSYLVAVYLGNSLPIIGIGLMSEVAGTLTAHVVFAVVIGLIAAMALAVGLKYPPQASSPSTSCNTRMLDKMGHTMRKAWPNASKNFFRIDSSDRPELRPRQPRAERGFQTESVPTVYCLSNAVVLAAEGGEGWPSGRPPPFAHPRY